MSGGWGRERERERGMSGGWERERERDVGRVGERERERERVRVSDAFASPRTSLLTHF